MHKLYMGHHSFDGPCEKGTFVVASFDVGPVLAENEAAAEQIIQKRYTIPKDHHLSVSVVRRSPKNRKEIRKEWFKRADQRRRILQEMGEILAWLAPYSEEMNKV